MKLKNYSGNAAVPMLLLPLTSLANYEKIHGMKLQCLLLVLLFCGHLFAQSGGPSADRESSLVNTAYLWRQAMGGAIIGRPTVQAQSVVMVLDGGSVKAYSVSGRPLWAFSARGRLSPYVTRSREGTVYICRTNGIFIAINRIGRELWRTNIGVTLSGPVVLGWDGRVFIPTAQKIFCYTASGTLLWTHNLDSRINIGPWLDQSGGILLALENGSAMRIDPFGASTVWQLPSAPCSLLSVRLPVTANGIAAAGLAILVLYRNGNVQLLNPSLPDAKPVDLPQLPFVPPAVPLAAASRGSNVAAALSNGQVILLSSIDGSVMWIADNHVRLLQGKGVVSEKDIQVIYDERGVYVLTPGGATGFSANGTRLWYTRLENASSVPAFGDDGVLYSGGTDWILYAWKLEEQTLNRKQTLYGPAPEGSYGLGLPQPSVLAGFPGRFDEAMVKNELDTIHRGIQAGKVGGNERYWINSLMEIAGSGLRQATFSYNRNSASIHHRILALQLLSRIGSSETIPWLVRFFRAETEMLLKAAAAQAIGGIGVDPNGMAIQEFLVAASRGNPVYNEQALIAVAAATGSLCRFSGPPLFDTGSRVLVLLSNARQMPLVRRQALTELESLGNP